MAKTKSPSFLLDSGERAWPFEPPSKRSWQRIVKKCRTDNPLPFPVKITRSDVAPDETTCDSGGVWFWYNEDGTVARAHIWVHILQQRAMAIDSLLHEWAHCIVESMHPNRDGAAEHDDAYWIVFGRLYRQWVGEPEDVV